MKRLVAEGRSISRYHVRDMRSIMENHLLTDPIAKARLSGLKRSHILDYRERLIEKLGYPRTVQKAVGIGIFTTAELRKLFPAKSPGPWRDPRNCEDQRTAWLETSQRVRRPLFRRDSCASGSISAVLGAYLVLFPLARVTTIIPVGNVAYVAHIGGFVYGSLVALTGHHNR